jgi:hypothetical protein
MLCITTCVLQSDIEIPLGAIKANVGDSLSIIIQMERRSGIRFVSEVLELRGFDTRNDGFDFVLMWQDIPFGTCCYNRT